MWKLCVSTKLEGVAIHMASKREERWRIVVVGGSSWLNANSLSRSHQCKNCDTNRESSNRMWFSQPLISKSFGVRMINREAYPVWRNSTPVPIGSDTLQKAQQLIVSCERCTPDLAEVPFDYVLDSITGCDPEVTDYVLTEPARCPKCGGTIQTGYWRWYDSEQEGRKVFILPGTLVTLKSTEL